MRARWLYSLDSTSPEAVYRIGPPGLCTGQGPPGDTAGHSPTGRAVCRSEGLKEEFTYLRKGSLAVPFVLFCGKIEKFIEGS